MTIDQFNQAKIIRSVIDNLNIIKSKAEKSRQREGDIDFNEQREKLIELCSMAIAYNEQLFINIK